MPGVPWFSMFLCHDIEAPKLCATSWHVGNPGTLRCGNRRTKKNATCWCGSLCRIFSVINWQSLIADIHCEKIWIDLNYIGLYPPWYCHCGVGFATVADVQPHALQRTALPTFPWFLQTDQTVSFKLFGILRFPSPSIFGFGGALFEKFLIFGFHFSTR